MCALNHSCFVLGVMVAVCSDPRLIYALSCGCCVLTHVCSIPEGGSPLKDQNDPSTPNESPRWYDRASGPDSTPRRAGERWSIAEMARWDAIDIAAEKETKRKLSQRLYRSLVVAFEGNLVVHDRPLVLSFKTFLKPLM